EPFQKPVGTAFPEANTFLGSFVQFPSPSQPPANGSSSSLRRQVFILPSENCEVAISSTTCPFSRGSAITTGLFPILFALPPHGGIFAFVLVRHSASSPASAACQP